MKDMTHKQWLKMIRDHWHQKGLQGPGAKPKVTKPIKKKRPPKQPPS